MKSFRILVVFIVFGAMLASCNEDDVVKDDRKISKPGVTFYGTFSLQEESSYLTNELDGIKILNHLWGEGDINIISAVTLELEHQSIIAKENGQVNDRDGLISLRNSLGDEIFGKYSSVIRHRDLIEIYGDIIDGTGQFDKVHGTFRIELKKIGYHEFKANIKGTLYGFEQKVVK